MVNPRDVGERYEQLQEKLHSVLDRLHQSDTDPRQDDEFRYILQELAELPASCPFPHQGMAICPNCGYIHQHTCGWTLLVTYHTMCEGLDQWQPQIPACHQAANQQSAKEEGKQSHDGDIVWLEPPS
jgi:hypothetical protein